MVKVVRPALGLENEQWEVLVEGKQTLMSTRDLEKRLIENRLTGLERGRPIQGGRPVGEWRPLCAEAVFTEAKHLPTTATPEERIRASRDVALRQFAKVGFAPLFCAAVMFWLTFSAGPGFLIGVAFFLGPLVWQLIQHRKKEAQVLLHLERQNTIGGAIQEEQASLDGLRQELVELQAMAKEENVKTLRKELGTLDTRLASETEAVIREALMTQKKALVERLELVEGLQARIETLTAKVRGMEHALKGVQLARAQRQVMDVDGRELYEDLAERSSRLQAEAEVEEELARARLKGQRLDRQ